MANLQSLHSVYLQQRVCVSEKKKADFSWNNISKIPKYASTGSIKL